MPPRSRHLPTPTPSARWNVTSPRSPNWLSTSKSPQPRPNCNRYERMPHARSAEFQMNAPIIETNTACLLVVDDQESNIQVVGAALGKLGFEILPVTGGLQAFQRLAVRRPDLILLDLLMPEMAGFELDRRRCPGQTRFRDFARDRWAPGLPTVGGSPTRPHPARPANAGDGRIRGLSANPGEP